MSWIQESAKRGKTVNNFYSFDGTDVYVMNSLPENVSIEENDSTRRTDSWKNIGNRILYPL